MSTAPSKEILQCYYCDYKARKDNFRLYDHFNKHHPGMPERYKAEKGQRALTDMFPKKRTFSEREGQEGNVHGGSRGSREPEEQPQVEIPPPEASTLYQVARPTPMPVPRPTVPPKAPPAPEAPNRPQAQLPITAYNTAGLASFMVSQSEKLDLLTAKVAELLSRDSTHQREIDFRRRIGGIGPFKLDEGSLRVRCTICDMHKWSIPRNERPANFDRIGVFYLGDELPPPERQRDIVTSLKRHLEISTHTRSVSIGESGVATTRRSEALAVARTAYFAVCEGHSYRSFERLLALQAENGVGFGDKNHSRTHFLPAFIKAMVMEIKARMISVFMDEQACFGMRSSPIAASCDKVTVQRRTLQATCAMVLVRGRVVAYLLSAPVAADKTGDGLTELLLTTLLEFGFDEELLRNNLVALATDGEYHGLRVGGRLSNALGCEDEQLYHSWCIAHRIELAVNDSHKDATDLRSVLHPAMPSRHGYAYEDLRDEAARLGVKFAAPLAFSATRWASSEARVYHNFAQNFRAILSLGAYPQVSKLDWLFKFAVCYDVMNAVTAVSCTAQTVNRRPWQVIAAVHGLRDTLIVATAELEALRDAVKQLPDARASHIGALNSRHFDIDALPTLSSINFVQRSWQGVELQPVSPWFFELAVQFCIDWMKQLTSALTRRILREVPVWLEACCQCLSGEALLGSQDEGCLRQDDRNLDQFGLRGELSKLRSAEDYFGVVAEFVMSFKTQLAEAPGIDGLKEQYVELRDRIRANFLPITAGEKVDMDAIWSEVHTQVRLYRGCEDCLYAIACVALKTHCESVVEAQCSTLNGSDPRRHLGHMGLAEEALLVWSSMGIAATNVDNFLAASLERMPESFSGFRRQRTSKFSQKKVVHSTVIDRVLKTCPHPELSGPRDFHRPRLAGFRTGAANVRAAPADNAIEEEKLPDSEGSSSESSSL
ncbi:hypothetical protein Pmar_PMAR006353 [Perkinsus marinus ATCC 50983]|uniref:Uncharacterized protein n=1 Tax=Perkinsus marinus (strain ATCC 50983 / TXsc) TaxID=423536 RepID=C5K9G3_PERM5|nr:hypothetical protein Pmar_PMAR006353 [Perkinsus marinus ATCC 50983]EER18735.1 hypothetical protein Pmar_PMAR006353 [Perkinsus marinus ATCC 50983]|eukprot:XP_002786939.1 hypothetical protein Pmar_PMAR006353 [Perkinsus marinus ATCC 50983]